MGRCDSSQACIRGNGHQGESDDKNQSAKSSGGPRGDQCLPAAKRGGGGLLDGR